MAAKKEDRRVQRTRNMLLDALLDLMFERGYDALTVQDIIDRADVGRSTFYSHFPDKEQLLIGVIDRLSEYLKEQIALRPSPSEGSGFRFGFSLAMLQHVQSHKRLYRAIAGKPNEMPVWHYMRNMLSRLAQEDMERHQANFGETNIPRELAVACIVTTFLTVLAWWMEPQTNLSAEACDRLFHKLALSGISGVNNAEPRA